MGMISVKQSGDFNNIEAFIKLASSRDYLTRLEAMGERGIAALRAATPVEHGETAAAWDYVIERNAAYVKISWTNSVNAGTAPLAVLLQLGHGTRNGGYVEGRDYINPTIAPIFDAIAAEAWVLVTK